MTRDSAYSIDGLGRGFSGRAAAGWWASPLDRELRDPEDVAGFGFENAGAQVRGRRAWKLSDWTRD